MLLAGGIFMLSAFSAGALAQTGEPKPPAPAEEEQKAEGDKKAEAQAKAEQEAAKLKAEYDDAAAKLPRSAGSAECVWTGRRVASLLWRDDIDTARRYLELYDRFGCSQDHLKLVFRCVIQQGPLDPKAMDRLASRVHACWIAPKEATQASSRALSGSDKDGTLPN